MSAASSTSSTSEERWARAAELAAGIDDDGVRRRRRVIVWSFVGLMVVSAVVTQSVGAFFRGPSDDTSDTGLETRVVVGLVLMLAGFLGALAGFVWAYATRHLIPPWRAILSPLSRLERISVGRQLKLKEPVDRRHPPVILAAAAQMRRSTVGLLPPYAGVILLFVGAFIALADSPSIFVLYLVAVVLTSLGPVVLRFQHRQLERFISANTASARQT